MTSVGALVLPVLAALTVASTTEARADDDLRSEVGVAVTLGGGVETFTARSTREATGPAGTWEVRGAIGTRLLISTEVAYFGSASTIHSVIGERSGTLVSSGVELIVRINVPLVGAWQPYVFTGRALRRYSVTDAAFLMSATGVNDSDDVIELPLGLGCTYHRRGGFIVDARATLRAAGYQDLVAADADHVASGDFAPMHTWSIGARLGYEF